MHVLPKTLEQTPRSHMRRFVVIAAFMTILTGTAHAKTVVLEDVLKQALSSSPAVARTEREYQERLSEGTAATTLDNPELQTDFLRQNNNNGNTVDIELSQPLRLSHLNGARTDFADMLGRAATTQQKYELLKTLNEVTTQYVKLWSLQERKSLYEHSAEDAENLANLVRGAAKQGQLAVSESTLFTADSARLRIEIENIIAEIAETKLALTRATGFSFVEIEAVKPKFSAIPPLEKLVAFSNERATLRNVIRDNLAAAEARMRVARSDAFPEFGPRLIYNRGFSGNDEQAVGAGVAMRIPLWDRNQAEQQRSRAVLREAQIDAASIAMKNPKEMLAPLQESAVRREAREQEYWNKILPGYRKSYDLSRQMLRAGQIPALDLWQVREKLYQIEEAALQSTLEAYESRLALELEIGGKLEEVQ